jgi:predicted ester cyclase
MFAMNFIAFPDFHITVDEMIAEGDKVAARWTATLTHEGEFMGIPPTGVQATISGMVIYRFADGKIVEIWHIGDSLGLLQQLGVVPPMS